MLVTHMVLEQGAVQVGDVFALLIEFYYSEQSFEQAYQMIEKMRQRRILLGPYALDHPRKPHAEDGTETTQPI
jgi:hypothetical protein